MPTIGIGGTFRLRPSHTTVRTGPYRAVREVASTHFDQGWETERFEVGIGEPTFTREPGETGIAHHIDGKNCGKATLFSSASNVRQGIGKSQPSPRASERPPQQDHGGHHDRAHQPNRMRPTARAPIIYNARDDHKLKDQTWD